MSRTTTLSRSARREAVRRKERQRKAITISILAVGLLLVTWGIYAYAAGRQVDQAAMNYTAADVVKKTESFLRHSERETHDETSLVHGCGAISALPGCT